MTAPLTERERRDGLAMIRQLLGPGDRCESCLSPTVQPGRCPECRDERRGKLEELLGELSWLEMVVEAEEGAGRVPSLWRGALRATQEELARMPAVEVRR